MSEPTDRIEKNDSCSPRSLPVYVRSKSSQLKRAKGGKRLNKRRNKLLYTKEVSACGTVGTFIRNGNLVNTDSHQSFVDQLHER